MKLGETIDQFDFVKCYYGKFPLKPIAFTSIVVLFDYTV